MTEEPIELQDLETAIIALYRGPLEDFIGRRDALTKQLRSSKRREDADQVKALRKPSRTAWALNSVVSEDAAPIEQLTAAVAGAREASGGGGDLRAALESVRGAVREVAAAAARAAMRAGQPIDATALVSAVNALIGDANAFDNLRTGRLVEIPEAGGLDFLSAVASTPAASPPKTERSAQPAPKSGTADAIRAAHADLQGAEASFAEARERAEAADRAVVEAQAKLNAAEEQLQRAKAESATRRADLERTREHAASAASQLKVAERAVVESRARVKKLSKDT